MNYKFNVRAINTENVEKGTKMSFSVVPYIIAIGVMIAYGFFIYFLIGKVGAEDPDWSRLIYLFSGVEAIVFAAAGFLFGREVNRKRAENAEEEKKRAEIKKLEIKKMDINENVQSYVKLLLENLEFVFTFDRSRYETFKSQCDIGYDEFRNSTN
ncbi:hypothetical protein LCGC14_2231500, partial [marine sediment metagenome]